MKKITDVLNQRKDHDFNKKDYSNEVKLRIHIKSNQQHKGQSIDHKIFIIFRQLYIYGQNFKIMRVQLIKLISQDEVGPEKQEF
ncbi:unnamed protein product [Paramecium primaurelia]|uniref:Uncharacterized protein n=1 Tax=Paramecium primaurelia TaxID=5886 RepID=A0A8S1QSZ3_PARPR|nr:unnamed protein product [Paramecium primaurelia]